MWRLKWNRWGLDNILLLQSLLECLIIRTQYGPTNAESFHRQLWRRDSCSLLCSSQMLSVGSSLADQTSRESLWTQSQPVFGHLHVEKLRHQGGEIFWGRKTLAGRHILFDFILCTAANLKREWTPKKTNFPPKSDNFSSKIQCVFRLTLFVQLHFVRKITHCLENYTLHTIVYR